MPAIAALRKLSKTQAAAAVAPGNGVDLATGELGNTCCMILAAPMLLPESRRLPPFGQAWLVYELKFDGYPMMAGVQDGEVQLAPNGAPTPPTGFQLSSTFCVLAACPGHCCSRRQKGAPGALAKAPRCFLPLDDDNHDSNE